MDAGRAGPFMMTVFVGGKAYWFMGERHIELEAETAFGETANWSYEKHRWAYEGGMGVRFRWLPE